jgi:hypothetical protein
MRAWARSTGSAGSSGWSLCQSSRNSLQILQQDAELDSAGEDTPVDHTSSESKSIATWPSAMRSAWPQCMLHVQGMRTCSQTRCGLALPPCPSEPTLAPCLHEPIQRSTARCSYNACQRVCISTVSCAAGCAHLTGSSAATTLASLQAGTTVLYDTQRPSALDADSSCAAPCKDIVLFPIMTKHLSQCSSRLFHEVSAHNAPEL